MLLSGCDNGIDGVSIAIGVLIHADEAPGLRVIVACTQVIQASCAVEGFAGVAVPCFLGIRRAFVAEGIEVQRFKGVALRVSDEARAALRVRIDVAGLSAFVLGNLQPHAVRRVRIAGDLPCAAIRPCALGDDFRVGVRRVQEPLRFRLVAAGFLRAADAPPQGIVAVADFGRTVAHALQAVVTCPLVGNSGRGRAFLNQVAAPVVFVGRGLSSRGFLRELVKLVVGVRGLGAVAILLRAVAYSVVLVGAGAAQALAARRFLGQLAVFVIFPRFGRGAAAHGFRGFGEPSLGITLVVELRQGRTARLGVRDAGEVASGVVAVRAA